MPSRTPPNTNANTMRLIAMVLTGDPSASDPGGRWPCRAIPRPSAGKNAARLSEEEPGAARLTREGADQHDDQEESETAAWIVAPARPVRRGGQRADGEQGQHDEKDEIHGRLSSSSLRVSHRCGELGAPLRSETTLGQRLPSFPALRAVEKTFSTSRSAASGVRSPSSSFVLSEGVEKCVEAARIVPDARRLASPDRQKYAAFTRIGFVIASPGSPLVVAAGFAVTAVLRERPDCSLQAG